MGTLITGLSGFVGSHCAEQMDAIALECGGEAVNITDRMAVIAAVQSARPDAVVHLAAQSSVADSFQDPFRTQEVNFLGTLNLLLALRETGFAGRFLYVGSGDCYGRVSESDLPITELMPLRPRSPYAVSKVAAEALCYQWSQTEGFEVLMARPFNHIGPRQSPRFVIAEVARQVSRIQRGKAGPVLELGDVDVTRDFTDVRDVVRAYVLLLKKGRNGEAYNVCSGVERTIRSVVELLAAAAGVGAEIRVRADRLRPAEQRRVCGSYAKLNAHTGWAPSIPIERSVADILQYWNNVENE